MLMVKTNAWYNGLVKEEVYEIKGDSENLRFQFGTSS